MRFALSLAAGAVSDARYKLACLPTLLVAWSLREQPAPRMPLRIRALVAEARLACAHAEVLMLRRQRDQALAMIERELAGVEVDVEPLTEDELSWLRGAVAHAESAGQDSAWWNHNRTTARVLTKLMRKAGVALSTTEGSR